jgi:radical SAM protein with 4Fe4S-binding SPASM domain
VLTLRFPLHIEIKITNACNLNCIHCISNAGVARQNELHKKEIFRIIDEAENHNTFTIGLTGGEPFLRKDIFEIIDYIRKKKINLTITTNGTLLDRKIIEKIKNKISLLRISLDHSGPIKHDTFRRSSGAFEKTSNAINLLKEYKKYFQVAILTVVSKYNFHDLSDIIRRFEQLGIESANFFLFVPAGRGKKLEKRLGLTPKLISQFCNLIEKERKKRKLKILTDNPLMSIIRKDKTMRICPAAITSCFITEKGGVLPCPYFYTLSNVKDNIRNKTLKEIWSNSIYFKQLRNINNLGEKCSKCKFKFSCFGGCRAGAFNKYNTIKKPDPMCWL